MEDLCDPAELAEFVDGAKCDYSKNLYAWKVLCVISYSFIMYKCVAICLWKVWVAVRYMYFPAPDGTAA